MTGQQHLFTTLGSHTEEQLGVILPHEHVFVDLGPIEEANYKQAIPEEVIEVIAPNVTEAKNSGVTAMVVSTPVGVGRRADIDHAVSEAAGLPLLVPTGIYRGPWIPEWAHEASEAELRDWMIRELTDEIEGTGVQAAWIKLSASDDGITDTEKKILRAAARAGAETDAVIGSHTVRGTVVAEQLDIIEDAGYRPDRFIWIHTQRDPDFETHLEIAQRGAWIEYDALGSRQFPDFVFTDRIRTLIDAGLEDRLLLSHDGGWYDPSEPGGGVPRPYTHLTERFIPSLRAAGIGEETIEQLTHLNPFVAFAR